MKSWQEELLRKVNQMKARYRADVQKDWERTFTFKLPAPRWEADDKPLCTSECPYHEEDGHCHAIFTPTIEGAYCGAYTKGLVLLLLGKEQG